MMSQYMQPAGQAGMHGRMYSYAPHPADMHGMAAGMQPGLDMQPGQVRACPLRSCHRLQNTGEAMHSISQHSRAA